MLIESIGLKNIKSFGNNRQEINFNINNPELILLTGRNGAGKSTIQETIDLALFNKVRGKNKKSIPLSALPNRQNKELSVDITFINSKNQHIYIKKEIEPNNFDITIDNISFTQRYSLMTEKEKEDLIGFNYDTFKSFISMSINDFLNFIELQKVDKRNLLNKLFNLEKIDTYLSISKDIIKNLDKNILDIQDKININIETINQYKKSIININKNEEFKKNDRILQIKNDAQILKDKIEKIKNKINIQNNKYSELENIIQDIKNKITQHKNKYQILINDLSKIDDKIKIFNSGICPSCGTNLVDDSHNQELVIIKRDRENVIKELIQLKNIINELKIEGGKNNIEINELIKLRNNDITSKNTDILTLKSLKTEFDILSNIKNDISIDEINSSILKLEEQNTKLNNDILFLENKSKIYNTLINIFDEFGIRSDIIKKIIKPINKYIDLFLNEINFKYKVVLDDDFNAIIYDRYNDEIQSETLSNGEIKIVNIIIALSYIKAIRNIKNINILFLDEIFVSIDIEYIELFIKLLKRLSSELKMNILIVHHGITEIDSLYFDRIIKVTNGYSSIIEEELIRH